MHRWPDSRGRAHWVALIALVILAAGFAAAAQYWRKPAGDPGARPVLDVIGEAPVETAVDSAAYKSRWLDDVRGLDLASLSPDRRAVFLVHANAQRCTCGCGYTLAGCRASDMSCEVSGPRLEALLDSVRSGRLTRADGLRAKPRGGG
jgi:hypothetical protein